MSTDTPFTKENLNEYLKELGKEFRKRNGKKMSAEIVLIGGAAILANYGFREVTYDIDAIILASSVMKEAINHVGDKLGLPSGWLNNVAGILWEHQKNGNPISREIIDKALITLYGDTAVLPAISKKMIDDAFADGDYERAYREIRESEKQAQDILLDFDKNYPGELKGENIDVILERVRQKQQ